MYQVEGLVCNDWVHLHLRESAVITTKGKPSGSCEQMAVVSDAVQYTTKVDCCGPNMCSPCIIAVSEKALPI